MIYQKSIHPIKPVIVVSSNGLWIKRLKKFRKLMIVDSRDDTITLVRTTPDNNGDVQVDATISLPSEIGTPSGIAI